MTTVPIAQAGGRTSAAAMLRVEMSDGLRAIYREPTALLFSIAMPLAFFLLFASLYGREVVDGTPVGTTMLATFGTFGVMAVTLMNPGLTVADERERGWLRAKRVTALPTWVLLTGKVIASLPYAVGVLAAMSIAAAALGALSADLVTLLRLVGVMVLGALPFALISLAVGFRAGSNAGAAILNAILIPSAVASGLWIPLDQLPAVFSDIAPFLPTYHLAQLGLSQLSGGPVLTHILVLIATAGLAGALAALSYRSSPP